MRRVILNGSSILLLSVSFLLVLSVIPSVALGRDPVPYKSGLSENVVFADPGEDPHLGFDTCAPETNSSGSFQGSRAISQDWCDSSENILIGGRDCPADMSIKHKLRIIFFSLFGFYFH